MRDCSHNLVLETFETVYPLDKWIGKWFIKNSVLHSPFGVQKRKKRERQREREQATTERTCREI